MLISNSTVVFMTHVFLQTLKYKKFALKENLSFNMNNSYRVVSSYLIYG